jgi:hypothetical protein
MRPPDRRRSDLEGRDPTPRVVMQLHTEAETAANAAPRICLARRMRLCSIRGSPGVPHDCAALG